MVQQIDESAGLQENHVHAVCPDRQGELWLALQHGISRVQLTSRFSIFDENSGLEQEWREVIRHRGILYVRGYKGLFAATGAPIVRTPSPALLLKSPQFRRISEIEPPVFSFVAVGNTLLVSSRDGIYEIPPSTPLCACTETLLSHFPVIAAHLASCRDANVR